MNGVLFFNLVLKSLYLNNMHTWVHLFLFSLLPVDSPPRDAHVPRLTVHAVLLCLTLVH